MRWFNFFIALMVSNSAFAITGAEASKQTMLAQEALIQKDTKSCFKKTEDEGSKRIKEGETFTLLTSEWKETLEKIIEKYRGLGFRVVHSGTSNIIVEWSNK